MEGVAILGVGMLQLPLDMAFHAIDQMICAQFRQFCTVYPRAVLITENGLLDHPLDWQDEREKAVQLAALQDRIRVLQPPRYAVVGEAWVTDWHGQDEPLAPSKSEVRKECLYILVRDRGGANIMGYREFVQPPLAVSAAPSLGRLVVERNVSGAFSEI